MYIKIARNIRYHSTHTLINSQFSNYILYSNTNSKNINKEIRKRITNLPSEGALRYVRDIYPDNKETITRANPILMMSIMFNVRYCGTTKALSELHHWRWFVFSDETIFPLRFIIYLLRSAAKWMRLVVVLQRFLLSFQLTLTTCQFDNLWNLSYLHHMKSESDGWIF